MNEFERHMRTSDLIFIAVMVVIILSAINLAGQNLDEFLQTASHLAERIFTLTS